MSKKNAADFVCPRIRCGLDLSEIKLDNMVSIGTTTPDVSNISEKLVEKQCYSMYKLINDTIENLIFKGEEKNFKGILSKEVLNNPSLKKIKLSEDVGVEDIFGIINRMGAGNLGDFEFEFYISEAMLAKLQNTFDMKNLPVAYEKEGKYRILGYNVNIIKDMNKEDGIIFADLKKGYHVEVSKQFESIKEYGMVTLEGQVSGKVSDYNYILVAQ